jgi:hypothetical protein
MSHHARERCAEMGISTKIAKRIVTDPNRTTYPARPGTMALSALEPEYCAVFLEREDGTVLVLTVLWTTRERYVRKGDHYETVRLG